VQRILIDITRLLYRRLKQKIPTGVDRVSLEYLRHYRGVARAVLSFGPFSAVLSDLDSARSFEVLLNPSGKATGFLLKLIFKAILWRWTTRDVKNHFLFNTGHMGLENENHAWMLRRLGARPIFVIHDLIPLTHPEFCRPTEYAQHTRRMRTALIHGTGLVAVSAHTLKTLETFSNDVKLTMPAAVIAHLGSGIPEHLPPGGRPFAQPYFVILATIEARKNHWLLLQIWRQLSEKLGHNAPKLIVIGQRGWECENVIDMLERCDQLKGHVIELSRCNDQELVTILHHAQALLFPSFAEGYGLPLIEALSLGAPVIASDLPTFRETAGDIPEFVDPLDGARWLSLIQEYAAPNSSMREAQIARMTRLRLTTWEEHLSTVDAFLEQLDAPRK
jgi:glycosyltransferase involved in cell wall biosynthesis